MCGLGSVSDRYRVPFWHSYTAAKDELRSTLRGIVELLNPMQRKALALMVNVSTTDTGNENRLRPNADHSFWLPPQTIVDRSLPILLDAPIEPPHYREMDVFQEQPGFDPAAYYGNTGAVLEKWEKEMGKRGKAD